MPFYLNHFFSLSKHEIVYQQEVPVIQYKHWMCCIYVGSNKFSDIIQRFRIQQHAVQFRFGFFFKNTGRGWGVTHTLPLTKFGKRLLVKVGMNYSFNNLVDPIPHGPPPLDIQRLCIFALNPFFSNSSLCFLGIL